ncbi:methyltransferase domain-containing protein [bacterium]|nr:methyltransferase domain-containing protein [bacterium]
MNWYEKTFGSRYLDLYSHRDESEARSVLALIRHAAAPLGGPPLRVLDLACGAGRYSRLLAAEGHWVAGLDLSAELLNRAVGNGRQAAFVRADMRAVPFAGSFDLALSMFTSFGYFDADRQNAAVLAELAGALRPVGVFLIDFMNRPQVIATLRPNDSFERDGARVSQRRWISPDSLRVEKEVLVEGPGGVTERYDESVRLFSRAEMEGMLLAAGLEVGEVFGDYDFSGYNDAAKRLILIGRKK